MENNKFVTVKDHMKEEVKKDVKKSWADDEDQENAWKTFDNPATESIDKIQQEQELEEGNRDFPKNRTEQQDDHHQRSSDSYVPPYRRGEQRGEQRGDQEYRPRIRPNNPVPENPPFTAKVNNLNFTVTEEQLEDYFGELGVKSVKVVRDREDRNKSKGFGYIEFNNKEGLEDALKADGTEFYGRKLEVVVWISKERYGDRNRSYSRPYGDRQGDRYGDRQSGDRYGGRGFGSSFRNNRESPQERKPLVISTEKSPGFVEQPSTNKNREDPFGGAKPVVPKERERPVTSTTTEAEDNNSRPTGNRTSWGNRDTNDNRNNRPYRSSSEFTNNRSRNQYNNRKPNNRESWDNKNREDNNTRGGWNKRGGKTGRQGGNTRTFATLAKPNNGQQPDQETKKSVIQNPYEALLDQEDTNVDRRDVEENDNEVVEN